MEMVSYAITGASRGLGLEFIRQLATTPSNLVFALVRSPASSPSLTALATSNPNIHIIPGDLNSLPSLQAAATSVASITGGTLDVLINNGAFLDGSTAMIAPSQLTDAENLDHVRDMVEKSIESNVWGTVYVTNSFLPLIEKGRGRKIVHITTGLADAEFVLKAGIAGMVPYSASKAMMNAIVAKYGVELQPKGIQVVAMSPGWVDTSPMPQEALEWMAALFRKVDPSVTGRIEVGESVRDQLKTIERLGWEVQGRVISQHGDRNWF